MPARGIHHIDLAVSDVPRSIAFYQQLVGPFGFQEDSRFTELPGGRS
jgi:catechol 2,3-dioxygenase-like lactoylglutathione lyase family enzyme